MILHLAPTGLLHGARLIAAAAVLATAPAATADLPAAGPAAAVQHAAFCGTYKISSSNDPAFPGIDHQEWFLDFGRRAPTRPSGTVAVTARQNPHLKLRLRVWQFSPDTGMLRLGTQAAQASQHLVAAATWQVTTAAAGSLLLRRGDYHALLVPTTTP